MRGAWSRAVLPATAVAAIACACSSGSAGAATPAAKRPPPPKPPSIASSSVTAPSASTATAKARINPHGLPTEYRFEYGTTTAYGALTPATSAGAGTQEVAVAQTIGGLAAYTTYHCRAVATSSAGTSRGPDVTFTTKRIPLSLTLTAALNPVVFGSPLSVSGALTGTDNAGAAVVLQGNPFPYTHGFHDLTAPVPASVTGAFSFPMPGLLVSTQLRAATVAKPAVFSPVLSEAVTLRVTLHVRPARRRGFVHLYGTVTPSAAGAPVAFELMSSRRQFVTISGTRASGHGGISHFARTIRLRHRGVYRALVEVPGGAQDSGRSRPIAIR